MSCRTTPAGSLATTWVTASTSLFDGQTTSLYHALRREHASLDDPTVTFTQYISALRSMHENITRADLSDARRTRFEARYQNALDHIPYTSNADRYALMGITLYARQAEQRLRRLLTSYALTRDMSEQDAHDRYTQAYRSATRLLAATAPRPADGIPADTGTRYALHVLANDPTDLRRCGTCGQFTSPQRNGPHTCPDTQEHHQPRPQQAQPARTHPRNPHPTTDTPPPTAATASAAGVTVTDTEPVDMDEFQDLYEKTQTSLQDGEPFPFIHDPDYLPGAATANLGNPDAGGNTFGIELELDFPHDDYPFHSRHDLARRLWEAGISENSHVLGWHHIGDRREHRPGGTYHVTPDNWVCEFDRTVDDVDGDRGVEVKSQILTDTLDTWKNLAFVCQQAANLDAAATPNTGLHVNIGTQGLSLDDPQQLTELLRTAGAYDDVLTRLAHNPHSGTFHRGRRYCQLTHVPPTGFYSVSDAQMYANHYNSINLSHLATHRSRQPGDSRVEMRLFDSSLDPGRIQAHINLSLALITAAKNGHVTHLTYEPAGTHRDTYGTTRLSGDDWANSTLRFRHLWSLLRSTGLNSPTHDRQFVRLFAASRWQRG